MTSYRYLFCDLLTDAELCYLDLDGVTFGRRIIRPGTFQGKVPIRDAHTRDKARKIRAGRTICHVYRGADIWGSYIVWRATPSGDEQGRVTLDLQGATLESAFYRRKIRANLSYTGWEQFDIARALITHQQARPEGNLGIQLAAGFSGIARDRTYRAGEAASYGQRLEQLAGVINGFEFQVQTYVDPVSGERVRLWVPGYPQLGNPAAGHQFTQRGNVLPWAYPDDATESANSWQARGDTNQDDLGTVSEPLMSAVFEDSTSLGLGWPLWDGTVDYSSVRIQATLDAHAQLLRDTRLGNLRIPQVGVSLGDYASLNPNRLGDSGTLTIVNESWFPLEDGSPSSRIPVRVIGMDVTPPTRGNSQERAKLIFIEEAV